ncbi:MAG: AAA family ATPase [Thermoplasmataceae archaeon]
MIIRSLHLESFLSHDDTTIEFDNGVNVIVGKNGAGKSSIFEGIKFALFGLQRGNRDLLQYGKKHGMARLVFKLGENVYTVERTLEMVGSRIETKGAILKCENTVLGEGAISVSREIARVIGVSDEVFMNSVFIEQGQIDSLIMKQKSKRLDLFNEILGLQNLQKVFEKLNDLRKNIELNINANEPLEEIYRQDEKRADEIEQSIREIVSQAAKENERYKESQKAVIELEKKVKELNEKKNTLAKLDTEIRQHKRRFDQLTGKINQQEKELEENARLEAELLSLENEKRYRFREQIKKYILNSESLEVLQKEIEEIRKTIKDAENRESRMMELNPANEEYLKLEKDSNELAEWIQRNSESKMSFSNKNAILADKKNQLTRNIGDLKTISEKISMKLSIDSPDSVKLNKKMEELNSENERLIRERSKAENVIQSSRREIGEIAGKMKMLVDTNECPVCKQPLTENHRRDIVEEYHNRETELKSAITGSDGFIAAAGTKISKIREMLDFINNEVLGKLSSLEGKNHELTKEIDFISGELDKLKGSFDTYNTREEELVRTRDNLKKLESKWKEYARLKALSDSFDMKGIREKEFDKNQKISEIMKENANIAEESGFIPSQGDIEASGMAERKIESIRKKIGGIEEQRKNILSDKKELDDTKQELERRNREYDAISVEVNLLSSAEQDLALQREASKSINESITRLDTRKDGESRELSRIKLNMEENSGKIAMLNNLRKSLTHLEKLIPAFRRDGLPRLIRIRSSQFITNMTTELMSHFNLSVEGVKVTEDLDIEVFQNGSVKELQQLSGGERTAVAIALRMAMAKYLISNISVLLMDEPTNFLDEDRRNDLKDIISYSLRDEGIVPQLIVITHHTELNTAADISYTVESRNGVSRILPS